MSDPEPQSDEKLVPIKEVARGGPKRIQSHEPFETEINPASWVKLEKKGIFYPNHKGYQIWELFMIFVLIFSCVLTPYEIAFGANAEG